MQPLKNGGHYSKKAGGSAFATDLLLRSSLVGRLLRLRHVTFVICNHSETNVRKIADTTDQ